MGFNLGVALGAAAQTGQDAYYKKKKQNEEDYKFGQYQQEQARQDQARQAISALPQPGATKINPDGTTSTVGTGDYLTGLGGALAQAGQYNEAAPVLEQAGRATGQDLSNQSAGADLSGRKAATAFISDSLHMSPKDFVQKHGGTLEAGMRLAGVDGTVNENDMTYTAPGPDGKPVTKPIDPVTLHTYAPMAAHFMINKPGDLAQLQMEAQKTRAQTTLQGAQAANQTAEASSTTALTQPRVALTNAQGAEATAQGSYYGVRAAHEGDLMDAQAGYYGDRGRAALEKAEADEAQARVRAAQRGQLLGQSKDGRSLLYLGPNGITAQAIPDGVEVDHLFQKATGERSVSPALETAAYKELADAQNPKDVSRWHSKWDPLLGGKNASAGPPPDLAAAFGPKPGAAPGAPTTSAPAVPAAPPQKALPVQYVGGQRNRQVNPQFQMLQDKLGPLPPEFVGGQRNKQRNPAYDEYMRKAQGLL